MKGAGIHVSRHDYNVEAADVNIFVETALSSSDTESNYQLNGFHVFRNDMFPECNTRTFYGTAFYIKNEVHCVCPPIRAKLQ